MVKNVTIVLFFVVAAAVLGNYGDRSRYAYPPEVYETKAITVGHPGSNTTDFAYTSAANTTDQHLDLGAIIPAFARVLDVSVICTEAVVSSPTGGTVDLDCGETADAADYFASANCDAANDSIGGAAGGSMFLAITSSTQSVFLNASPGVKDWDEMTAGEWTVIVTYLDLAVVK